MLKRRIAVLGGGNGAHSYAGDLALAGHDVRLFELPAFANNVAWDQMMGGIELVASSRGVLGTSGAAGGATGFTKVGKITTDIAEAVVGAEVIFVVVPAFGQRAFMEALIPVLEDGQMVIFCPGKFACLEFNYLLSQVGRRPKILMGETESMLFISRLQSPGRVLIKGVKQKLQFATLPMKETPKALAVINEFYPQFVPAQNVLETSFYTPGIVIHPVTTLMNTVKIEQMAPFRYSYYDLTPSVARVMEVVDGERTNIASRLGLPVVPMAQKLNQFYGSDPSSIFNAITSTPGYKHQTAPESLTSRVVTEDVPYAMVPISFLGRAIGVSTRALDTIINLACFANGADYWAEGRTLTRLGMEGMHVQEIRKLVS